jgi:hypothetical protein
MRKALIVASGFVTLAGVILMFAACRNLSPGKLSLRIRAIEQPTPAPPGSRLPNVLSGFSGDRLALSWVETEQDERSSALRFSVLKDGQWSGPKTVETSTKFNPHPSVLPAIAVLGDGTVVAEWTQLMNGDPKHFSEDVYASASRDLGSNWSKPVRVNRDNTESEHSLVSIAAGQRQANLVWLDGRHSAENGEYALVHASVDGFGTASAETVLDASVCTCCPTAITGTPNGLAVAYRDRSPDEIRDISLLRFENGSWLQPAALSHDGWRINACPNNGPALSSGSSGIVAAWFTAADDAPRVKVAFSTAGEFRPPVVVDEGNPVRHVAIALLSSGDAAVVWVERKPDGARLLARRVNVGGRVGPSIQVASGTASGIGFPRIAAAGNVALVTWTQQGDAPQVRASRLEQIDSAQN